MEAAGVAAAGSRSDAAQEVTGVRLRTALAASAVIHGVAILLAVRLGSAPLPPALVAFSVSLIAGTGGDGGGAAAAPEPAVAPEPMAATPPAVVAPLPTPTPHRRAAHPTARGREASRTPTDVAPALGSGEGTGIEGGGNGFGGGAGGDGSAGEGAAYGTNPLPPYPIVARRLGMEGVVLLDVLVAPDGHAADVRVARSSGHPALDESALTTVRERWRFVPARRDGVPVESRVTVPIRFRLAV